MGVDLTLVPQMDSSDRHIIAGTRLQFARERDFFEQIEALPSYRLPQGTVFSYYNSPDDPDAWKNETPYGDPLTFVYAADFERITGEPTDPINAAILVFLRALPPDMRVVLYWH